MCYETGFTISMVTSGLTCDFQHYKTALFLSKFMWIVQDIFFVFGISLEPLTCERNSSIFLQKKYLNTLTLLHLLY